MNDKLHPEFGVQTNIQFTEVSMVPASKCSECSTPMEPASSTEWACVQPSCPEQGKAVHTGVYPIRATDKQIEEVTNPKPAAISMGCKVIP